MSDDRERKIREKAYSLWEEGGGEHGRHDEHWRHAEEELGNGGNAPSAPAQDQPAEGEAGAPNRKPGSPKPK